MAIKTSLIIDLSGNLQSRARQMAASLEAMGRRGQSALRGMESAGAAIGRKLDTMAGKYAAMIGGGAAAYKGMQAVKASAQMDKMLSRVARTAGATREEAAALREELYAMAKQTGQPVEDLLEGFYGLVQAGQSWSEALGTIKAINPTMAVTGASADTLASSMTVAAQAFKFDLSDTKTAALILDQMTKAGDLGNAELEALSGIFSRVGNSAKNAGLDFSQTLALIERMSLVEKNPERLATLVDSTLRLFNNQQYMKTAQDTTGVKFYDANGERRAAFDVLDDIAAKYQKFTTDAKRDSAFASAFGKTDLDTQRGLRILLDKGTIDETRKMAGEVANASGTISQGLPEAIKNSADQVARLKAALGEAADEFARPVNDAITRGIKYLLDEKQIGGKEMLAGGAAASVLGFGATKLAGRALMGLGKSTVGNVLGGMSKGGGLGGVKLPMPVFVVNRHMSLTRDAMIGGGFSAPAGGGGIKTAPGGGTVAAGARRLSMLGRAGNLLGRLAVPLTVATSALTAGAALMDESLTTAQKIEAGAEASGAAMGGWAGAALGAAIGSVVPGIGTAIGGILGGLFGSLGGGALAQAAAKKVTDPEASKAITEGMQEMADKLGYSFEQASSESVVKVIVEGGTGTVVSHSGPGNVDVYSGGGYAYEF
ncbi:MAG: phage tail tape measure protein [Desulfovibrio sp.]|jgi:TP901 family phage tail tape measure protein|nr:phage tail tape measure protein [Desulfovibrio sp.]